MPTVDQLITAIRQNTVNRTSGAFDTNWYRDRLQEGYDEYVTFRDPESQRPVRFPQFFANITLTITANPADNFQPVTDPKVYAILGIRDTTNSRDIRERPHRELIAADHTDTGPILKWAASGDATQQGFLYWKRPTANTTLRLHVYKYPETLALGANFPVMPAQYHRGIELFASAIAADKLGIPDRRDELQAMAIAFARSHRTPTQETRRRRRGMNVWRRHPTHAG